MGDFHLNYDKTQFFYKKTKPKTGESCTTSNFNNCGSDSGSYTVSGCSDTDSSNFNHVLCKNYKLGEKLINGFPEGNFQNFIDADVQYLSEYYRTYNLSAGIIGILAFYFLL